MQHSHALIAVVVGAVLAPVAALPAGAASSRAGGDFGRLYLDGRVVRTLGVPAALPRGGLDPLYVLPAGAAPGQLAVTAVGPGTGDYHGGSWAIYVVRWAAGVTPYLLTSDEAVDAAAAAGDITLTRDAAADFRCPVLP